MLDRATEISVKSRLEASRTALLLEMGIATSTLAPNHGLRALPAHGLTAKPPLPSSVQRSPSSLWRFLGLKALRVWWAKHPAHSAVQVARPMLQPYAKKHPGHLIAGGMALGSVLYVLRPWRLLSLSTLTIWALRGPALPRKIFGLFRKTQKSMSRTRNA
jgi:hypothetical protein